MTLAEMFTALHAKGLIPNRVDAKKSSLRHFARALGYRTLELCPVRDACRDPDQWKADMQAYFATRRAQGKTMTAKHCDDILSDVRGVLRLAEAEGLLTTTLPVRLLKPTETQATFRKKRLGATPYQATYGPKPPYRLPQAQWPDDIQEGWWIYTDVLNGKLREISLRRYVQTLESYFGYLAHVHEQGTYTPTWDDLFRVDLLGQFVRWHADRVGRDGNSAHGVYTVRTAAAIANVLELDKSLPLDQSRRPPLAAYSRNLKRAPELHDKFRYHWTTLMKIEEVANSLIVEGRILPARQKKHVRPGLFHALRFQMGLILKLLVRVPLRQRNVRELRYPHNLWKHQMTREWTLRFVGEELKVGWRNGKVNVFEARLSRLYPKDGLTPAQHPPDGLPPDDFIPTLEEFLRDFRPIIPNGKPDESPYLFLTCHGTPYSSDAIYRGVVRAVVMRIGVWLNPHMIRDIATTELLKRSGKDYDMVASLLGNTPMTLMKHYAHLIPEEEQTLAAGHIGAILRTG
jgi:hypothetical protein